jgi:hypothetical protein
VFLGNGLPLFLIMFYVVLVLDKEGGIWEQAADENCKADLRSSALHHSLTGSESEEAGATI